MKRKIVKQGAATMTISLPASWIKKFNLKVGDELNLDEAGNKIEISTEKAMGETKAEIDVEKLGDFTKTDLSHLYIAGYDEITINFKDKEVLRQMQERVPDCIGYEIIDQSEDQVKIKSISSALEGEFENILRKVFLILKEMADNVYAALKNNQFQRLRQIKEMETINNKFTSFLLRLLNKKGYKKANRSLQAYDMIQNLERLADEYKYLCDNLTDSKKPVDKTLLELLKQTNEYYKMLYAIHYKFDPNKKKLISKTYKELNKKANELLRKNKEPILAHHLIALIEKIRNTSGSFFAIITD